MANAKDSADLQPFNASDYHVGVIIGLFNSHITKPMKELVLKTLTQDYQVPKKNIILTEVAGAADIPAVLEALALNEKIDCIIPIAAIIRGSTSHFEYVAKVATEAIKDVQIKHAKPISFGVLTVDNEEQALKRIDHAIGYTAAALHTTKTIRAIK